MSIQSMLEELAARTEYKEPMPVHTVTPRPMCDQCRDYEVMDYGDICEHCQKEWNQSYRVMYKMGRLANGAALDGGTIYHAVEVTMPEYGMGKAFCNAKPGRHSAGWMRQVNQEVTCQRCLDKLARIDRRAQVAAEMYKSRQNYLDSLSVATDT